MTLAAVEVSVLLKVVGISLVATLVLTLAYSLCLWGGTAYVERRRTGHDTAAIPTPCSPCSAEGSSSVP